MGFRFVGSRLLDPETSESVLTVYRKVRSRCVWAIAKRPSASSNCGRFVPVSRCIERHIRSFHFTRIAASSTSLMAVPPCPIGLHLYQISHLHFNRPLNP